MDSGKGHFDLVEEDEAEKLREQLEDDPQSEGKKRLFEVGEIVIVKGSRFRVSKIMRNRLMLKLLPKVAPPEGTEGEG